VSVGRLRCFVNDLASEQGLPVTLVPNRVLIMLIYGCLLLFMLESPCAVRREGEKS
jgi:hypothetical protein